MRKLIMAIVLLQSTLGFAVATKFHHYSVYLHVTFTFDEAESNTPNFTENFLKELALRIQEKMPAVTVTNVSHDGLYECRIEKIDKDTVPLIGDIIDKVDSDIKQENYQLAHEFRTILERKRYSCAPR